ncbi:MAG: hypothetical protein ACRD63_05495 [Pyrinomonadaceae bacterium]
MDQQDKKSEYFAEEEAPLPVHVLMIREMPMPRYGNRYCESKAARAKKYDCFHFYKHISRPLPLNKRENKEDDRMR